MHYLDDRELKELLQLRQPPLGHLGTINNYRGVLGYCQLDGPYAVNKGVRTRGSERYSHNRRRHDTLKDGGKMYFSGDVLVRRRNASMGHLCTCTVNTCVITPPAPKARTALLKHVASNEIHPTVR